MTPGNETELAFVVDIGSFTESGFKGATKFGEGVVDVEFDDIGDGLFLTAPMAKKIGVRKGSFVVVLVEGEATTEHRLEVTEVGSAVRFSNEGVWQSVAPSGGAVIRVRKA